MDKIALVEKEIEDGKKLLEELDKNSFFLVKAALWLYIEELNDWRLIIASPYLDDNPPQKAYHFINEALKRISPDSSISLKDITIISNKHALISTITRTIQIAPKGIGGVRMNHTVLNGIPIESAYIYRLAR